MGQSTLAQEPERGIYSAATVEMLCRCGINSALRPLSLRPCVRTLILAWVAALAFELLLLS